MSAKTDAHFTEILPSHTSKTKPFGQDFDDEVATEQLAAVVDGTLMPHNFPEIS